MPDVPTVKKISELLNTEHLPPKNDENDETTPNLRYPLYKWIDISANRQVIKQFLNASSSQ